MTQIGARCWVIADGTIPPGESDNVEMFSHEGACMFNPGPEPADIEITLYFKDRPPVGPYRVNIPPERILHQKLNDLSDPEPVPHGVDYSIVIRSSAPIVVQHTRQDNRQPANAIMTTIAYAVV